jgi:hypothetical protein
MMMDTVSACRHLRSVLRVHALLAGGVVLLALALTPARGDRLPLPPELQEKVNEVVDFGVLFLRKTQLADGTWPALQADQSGWRVAYAALPALTLLECGEPPRDRVIQRAAAFVRRAVVQTYQPTVTKTYELALAILLLDRLAEAKAGEARDKVLIQTMALQLIASQNYTGGWGYECAQRGWLLSAGRQAKLMAALRRPAAEDEAGLMGDDKPDANGRAGARGPRGGNAEWPLNLSPELRSLPVLQNPELFDLKADEKTQAPFFAVTDNSNSQFAILALWAARRHDVPLDRTMRMVVRRYETSQNKDGAWDYNYSFGGRGDSAAMNCCALLGLALGRGAGPDKEAVKGLSKDPHIVAGFAALSKHVGKDGAPNPYFLWSLERVAVLYDLPKIGDKDWYRWGAEKLVASLQSRAGLGGYWETKQFPGSSPVIDTSMALLFLKKSNLIKDAARKLPVDSDDLAKRVMDKLGPVAAPPKASVPPPPAPTPQAPMPTEPPAVNPSPPPEPAAPTPPQNTGPAPPRGGFGSPGARGPGAQQAAAKSGSEAKSEIGSRKVWVISLLSGCGVLAVASVLLLWMHVRRKAAADADEEDHDRPRKGKRKSGAATARNSKAGATKSGIVAKTAPESSAAAAGEVVEVTDVFDDPDEIEAEESGAEVLEESPESASDSAAAAPPQNGRAAAPPAGEMEATEVVEDHVSPAPAPAARRRPKAAPASGGPRNGSPPAPVRKPPPPAVPPTQDDEVDVIDGLGDDLEVIGEPEEPPAAPRRPAQQPGRRPPAPVVTDDDALEVVDDEESDRRPTGRSRDNGAVSDGADDDAVDVLDDGDDI